MVESLRTWARSHDWSFWLLLVVALFSLIPRLYGLNWDANNHLHPDEREIVFKAMCLSLPGTPRVANCDPVYTGPGWFFSQSSPLNPHFFAYGSLPLYLLAAVSHALVWLTGVTHGRFVPTDGGAWDDFNHFTLVGRALSALFDAASVLLAGLLARRLAGRWAGVLAAAFVATIAFDVQVAHFYAVDTLLLFFVLLTLLGCVALAQGPHVAPVTDSRLDGEPPIAFWGSWRIGLAVGVAFALALATKVSALPLLAPMLVALALRWRRRGFDEALLAALGMAAAAVIVYLLISPYTLIDWQNFQHQINEQNALSRGQLDYPYVRQFAGTTPFVYPIEQMLLYDMGLPLGLLGLAGFCWAVARVWRRLDDDWSILIVWLVSYFAVVGSAYMKFSRYMLPVFAPLAICGAASLVALAAWGTRALATPTTASDTTAEQSSHPSHPMGRYWQSLSAHARRVGARATAIWGVGWWRACCVGLGLTVLAVSTLFTLAMVNLYSAPNTRVRASEWIYDHVPLGATLTNEIWDDPLPIQVPAARTDANGMLYTHAGHVINPGIYPQVGLDLYAEDTPDKATQLASQLASADVVVISSQRLLRSIPKLPDRYPMTTRYYNLLFAGRLGFTLAAHFEDHPHFLGFTLNDTGADESYSVYDHPPVWIFTRNGAGLNKDQIRSVLTAGISLPAASTRSGSQKSLLLPAQNADANAQSSALYAQLSPQSLPNQIPLLWWLLVVELLGLISFPLAYTVFPGLRDRGWGFAKTLGLLVLAYLVWLPSSLRLLPFDRWMVVAAFVLLAAAGAAITWWRRAELWAFVRERWRLLLIGEVAFVAAFLFFCWIRAQDPDLWHIYRGGEKPMELAYLDAILRSRYMPPYDPWFAGGAINYYYYGQYLIAVLIKLTGIVPTTAFNLAIPLLFALTFVGAYSIVAGLTGRAWAGLAAGFGMVVLGNLDGLMQVIGQWRAVLAHQPPSFFDYWASSRVIPYTINEFPYWSFLYADLHAHVIDLPIVLLLIGCCASLVAFPALSGRSNRDPLVSGADVPTLAMVALALGAAWCINTWDVPTYALLVVLVLGHRLRQSNATDEAHATLRAQLAWQRIRWLLLALGLTLAASYVLYQPFHATYQNFVSGIGTVTMPTDPNQFAILFGVWLFLLVSFFVFELRDRMERMVARSGSHAWGTATQRLWALLGVCVFALIVAHFLGLKAILLLLIAVGLFLALDPRHSPAKLMTYVLLLLGLAVALGVEIVYVRDFLDGDILWRRMNTVFKFYYQVWTLFAIGGALAFAYLASRAWPWSPSVQTEDTTTPAADDATHLIEPLAGVRALFTSSGSWSAGILRLGWALTLLALVAGSSIFLFDGTQARLQDPAIWATVQPPPGGVQPQGLSLDGMAFMRGWYPGDYDAITWLNSHVGGTPTIVEASTGVYHWHGRVSEYTGLPTVVELGHESEQRYPDGVYARQNDVEMFWSTDDPNTALDFLRKYSVRYIYVGALERTCYVTRYDDTAHAESCVPMSPGAIAKFQVLEQGGVLRAVYHNADVAIYEVTG